MISCGYDRRPHRQFLCSETQMSCCWVDEQEQKRKKEHQTADILVLFGLADVNIRKKFWPSQASTPVVEETRPLGSLKSIPANKTPGTAIGTQRWYVRLYKVPRHCDALQILYPLGFR